MEEKATEIANPWCVYSGLLGPWNFGKIVSDYGNAVDILYSEGQQYLPQCWDAKNVKRFATLEEAVEFYVKNRPGVDVRERDFSDDEIKKQARKKFPSYFEGKK